jgi:hypothetical protein
VRDFDAKVTTLPGDLLPWTDAARGDASDGFLAGEISGGRVQVYAARQVKYALQWGIDLGFEVDSDH